MTKYVIVNVNLEFKMPEGMDEDGDDFQDWLLDIELPDSYVSDSFEFVKIYNEMENKSWA